MLTSHPSVSITSSVVRIQSIHYNEMAYHIGLALFRTSSSGAAEQKARDDGKEDDQERGELEHDGEEEDEKQRAVEDEKQRAVSVDRAEEDEERSELEHKYDDEEEDEKQQAGAPVDREEGDEKRNELDGTVVVQASRGSEWLTDQVIASISLSADWTGCKTQQQAVLQHEEARLERLHGSYSPRLLRG
jgi:hypothetical protein